MLWSLHRLFQVKTCFFAVISVSNRTPRNVCYKEIILGIEYHVGLPYPSSIFGFYLLRCNLGPIFNRGTSLPASEPGKSCSRSCSGSIQPCTLSLPVVYSAYLKEHKRAGQVYSHISLVVCCQPSEILSSRTPKSKVTSLCLAAFDRLLLHEFISLVSGLLQTCVCHNILGH